MDKAKLQFRLFELESKIQKQYDFKSILGQSKPIIQAVDLAARVAPTDTTVLLLGETGTGKEVFAQAIHYESPRKTKPFVALNCSGFNPDLLESELFGYKQGAFTGAQKDKKGLLQEANEGTLFLDEIGEMNLDLQAKLLRVLENQTFIKLGDTQTMKVNVRIIAATNRDLQKEAEESRFRLDLFYRLSVFSIELPSLNERKGDVLILAKYYLKQFAAKVNKPDFKMDEQFMERLQAHAWKGNIRELKNVIERVVILADGPVLDAALLPFEFQQDGIPEGDGMKMETVEKLHILKVLKYTNNNKTETSRLLGIGLTTLYRKLEEYHIG
jgi:two-component system NtrC family response regulator